MSSIGFFPLPEPSHVSATFGIAKALKLRGHRVKYIAPLEFEELITNQEFDYIPFCEDLMPKGSYHRVGTPFTNRELGLKMLQMICKGQLDGVIRHSQLDLFVVDSYAQHMALIGYKIGIPTILMSPTIPRARDPQVPPVMEPIVPKSLLSRLNIRLCWCKHDLARLYMAIKGLREQFIKQIAISVNYPLSQIDYRGIYPILKLMPELVLCPQEFDLPRSRAEKFLHYIGAYTNQQRGESPEFPWEKIKEDKPLIYAALGSLSHRFKEARSFLQTIIDAVAVRQDLQLVLSTGEHLNANDFRRQSSNVILVSRAPQIDILKRADVMITHGGLNSVKECIMQAVPMIVLPWTKPVNAVRVVYHGLGLMGDVRKVSAKQIQSMIDTILKNPSFRMHAESMREKFIEADRSDLGVKAIELVLSARSTKVLMGNTLQ
ncbi:MAG: glycosyltransferase [Blastocatellia bacterium]